MEEEINIEESHREIVIPGEIIISGSDYLPGDGTKREGNDIVAYRYGLSDKNGKLIKIIPLSGVFIPRRGNVIIGRVNDITFNGWLTDIDSAISAFLPLSEVPRYIDKNNMAILFLNKLFPPPPRGDLVYNPLYLLPKPKYTS